MLSMNTIALSKPYIFVAISKIGAFAFDFSEHKVYHECYIAEKLNLGKQDARVITSFLFDVKTHYYEILAECKSFNKND